MDASPPQLHDSLDLAALKQQGKAAKIRYDKAQRIHQYSTVFLGIAFGFGIFFRSLFSITKPASWLAFLVLLVLLAITALIAGSARLVIFYRRYTRYIGRLNNFVPAFVPRVKNLYLTFFRPVPILIYTVIILALFLLESNRLRFGVVILVYLYVILYRRFLIWTFKGGLPRIEKVAHYLPNHPVLTDIRISLLINVGRIEEAERLSYAVLMRADVINLLRAGFRLKKLGFGLTMVAQYEKALPLLEAAIQILPSDSDVYDQLALWYLERHDDSERALQLTEIALDFTAPEAGAMRAIYQANNAHALALTGQDNRADVALTAALKSSNKLPAPASAEIHRQAGYVRLAQNNREAAVEHFQKAIELDPNGIYGKLARRVLDSLPPLQ
ncbi:MAG: tetratricopeptide repeat protein [Chloroflexota bacterium]